MTKVRWGVLGCASIAVNKVIPAMQRSERVRGGGDRLARRRPRRRRPRHDSESPAVTARTTTCSPTTRSRRCTSRCPTISTPSGRARAAAAGKHVLCEKPLGLDVAEVVDMIEACRAAGVMLMEAFMYRLHPLWQRAHELVADGAIGELQAIQARFTYHNVDPANIRNVAAYGGGAVMDIGCYPINVARWFFGGEPSGVTAVVRRDPAFGTDALTSAILDFDGRQASFVCSTQLEPDQRVHLLGTDGPARGRDPVQHPARSADPARPGRRRRPAGGPRADRVRDRRRATRTRPRPTRSRAPCATASRPPCRAEDAVGNMRVIERILAF